MYNCIVSYYLLCKYTNIRKKRRFSIFLYFTLPIPHHWYTGKKFSRISFFRIKNSGKKFPIYENSFKSFYYMYNMKNCEHPALDGFVKSSPRKISGSIQCPDCKERIMYLGLNLYNKLVRPEVFK